MKLLITKLDNGYTLSVTRMVPIEVEVLDNRQLEREEKRRYAFETKEPMMNMVQELLA